MSGKMGISVLSSQPHDASLGILHARLLLEDPRRIHHGSEDPVTGNVSIRIAPTAGKSANSTELFGPLEVNVTLKGTIRILSGNSSHSESSPQNDVVFVSETVKVHTGPFRAATGTERDFPFSINFPEHADAKHKTSVSAYQDAEGNWKFRQRLSDTTIENLPPTLSSRGKGAIVKSDMTIRYSLSLKVDMPGIDIKIINPAVEKEILYDRPRVPAVAATMQSDQTMSFKQQLCVEHKSLKPPENGRSSSSLKSLFKSSGPLPRYAFDVTCTGIPQHIFIGQPIDFNLSLSTDWDKTTAAEHQIPDVSLTICTISLISHTRGKRFDSFGSLEEPYNTEVLKEKTCDVVGFSSATPQGWVDVGTLSAVPSTFKHEDISREYRLKIMLSFSVLGQTMNVMRMLSVTVHPPLLEDYLGVGRDDDAENVVVNGAEAREELPAYDAVVAEGGATPSYFERILEQ